MTSTPVAAARIIDAIRKSLDAEAIARRQRPDLETPRAPSVRSVSRRMSRAETGLAMIPTVGAKRVPPSA